MIHKDRSRGTLASATAPLEFSAIFCVCFPCFPPGGRAVSAERAPDAGSLTPLSVCQSWRLGRALATNLSSLRPVSAPLNSDVLLVGGAPPLERDGDELVGVESK